jgi:hypothetical protein
VMKGFITLEATCPSAAAPQRQNGNEIGLSPGGRSHHFDDEGVHHFGDEGFITSSQLVDSGAVIVKWAFLGERAHRRRHARCNGAVALCEPVGRSVIGGPDPLLVF